MTQANGINPQGDIVGRYNDASGAHGWLFSEGQFSTIQFPGSTLTVASQINARGEIVGRYAVGTEGHGFTLIDGVYESVDVPGATGTNAVGINGTSAFGIDESGDVCGLYVTPDGVSHGFLLRHVYSWGTFDPCGNAVNGGAAPLLRRTEMRVGGDFAHPCQRSALITIDFPGTLLTGVRGVTHGGHLAMGNISTDKKLALFHGFLYESGLLTQFDYEGAATTEVFDVNARGEFVGRFNMDGGSLFHGYVCR